jgi:hypothetical protein
LREITLSSWAALVREFNYLTLNINQQQAKSHKERRSPSLRGIIKPKSSIEDRDREIEKQALSAERIRNVYNAQN